MFFVISRPPDQKRMSSLLLNDVFARSKDLSPPMNYELLFLLFLGARRAARTGAFSNAIRSEFVHFCRD